MCDLFICCLSLHKHSLHSSVFQPTTGSLYTPVPEPIEPCKITLVTENSVLQQKSWHVRVHSKACSAAGLPSGQIHQEHLQSNLTPGWKAMFHWHLLVESFRSAARLTGVVRSELCCTFTVLTWVQFCITAARCKLQPPEVGKVKIFSCY